MLSKGDDYPIHQLPEPIAFSGVDRNFYDRYFFNGHAADGSSNFAVAFGIYPHINLIDAHFAVVRDGVEYCIHASRHLGMERMDLQVGPIAIIVEEPLQRLRITIAPEVGITADLVFEGRHFPIEEPRFQQRVGPRTVFDYTRMTQTGRYSGWIEVDGKRETLAPGAVGVRDRSWGIRPLGAPDTQPFVPPMDWSLYWRWTPLNLTDRSVFFHVKADRDGHVWNSAALIARDGATAADIVQAPGQIDTPMETGTRLATSGLITIHPHGEPAIRITLEPIKPYFQMRGIGYQHALWSHGSYKGERLVEREDFALAGLDPARADNLHVQAISRVTLEQEGHPTETGIGTFEQMIIGPYAPLGLTGATDGVA